MDRWSGKACWERPCEQRGQPWEEWKEAGTQGTWRGPRLQKAWSGNGKELLSLSTVTLGDGKRGE